MSNENPFAIPSRQSPVGMLFILGAYLWRTLRGFWPVLVLIIVQGRNPEGPSLLTIFIIGYSFLQVVLSIISYFRFYYYVEGEDFVIEQGVLRQKSTRIPFSRIQSVNIERTFLHEWFQVVRLHLDTAGSSGKEAQIDALPREKAELIRAYVLEQKEEMGINEGEEELEAHREGEEEMGQRSELSVENDVRKVGLGKVARKGGKRELLLRRSLGEIVKVGLSRNHLQALGLIFGGLLALWNLLREFRKEEQILEQAVGYGSALTMGDYILGGTALLATTILLSLIQVSIRFYGLSLYKTQEGFTWQAGLFNKVQRTASLRKVQFVQWYTDPLKRIWKFFTFKLFQAGSSAGSKGQTIAVPGNSIEQVDGLLAYIYQDFSMDELEEHRINEKIVFRRVLFRGVIPAALITVANVYFQNWWGLLWLLWIPAMYVLAVRYYERFRYYLNGQFLLIQSGIWIRQYTLIPLRRAQAVSVSAGIYQRRHDLADLSLYTPAGTVQIPYMEGKLSRELRDYILYVVEKDEEAWM